MPLPIFRSPEAEAELYEAYRYLHQEAGADAAEGLIRRLSRVFGRLANFPGIGQPAEEFAPGLRVWRVKRYPYRIFYRVGQDRIEVVRVLHERRDVKRGMLS